MTVPVRDLHNDYLYGPSSLYYLGKVQFSSFNQAFWRLQRTSSTSWRILSSSGLTGIFRYGAGDCTASPAVRV